MSFKLKEKSLSKSRYKNVYQPQKDLPLENDVYLSDATSSSFSDNNNSSDSEISTSTMKDPHVSDIESLSPEKVRWFYKEKKTWTPFCGYDSLRLETKYRELKNHGEEIISNESLKEMIVVRGDLFEVNVLKREGLPIYWIAPEEENNSFLIMRGTWFREGSWQPIDNEELADLIEHEHVKHFRDVKSQSSESRKSSATDVITQHLTKKFHFNVHSVIVNGYHVEWYDENTVYCYTDSASHFIRQRLGLTKVGSKLHRGYKHEARIDDKLPDITHLVFVIHGIGQKMKGGDIVYQVTKLRTLTRKVTKRFFPKLDGKNHRVEYLPVEWRKLLVLDGNTVDLITPTKNKSLRNAVNSTALDILYYSSPIYRPEMIESLRSELNRLYSMFCARSPYFEDKGGKVSILAHSLGAVLVYDILTDWSPAKIYEYLEKLDKDAKDHSTNDERLSVFSELNEAKESVHRLEMQVLRKAEQDNDKRGQSNFREANFPSNFIHGKLWKVIPRLENFFCVGSPLAVFLALRGMKPLDNDVTQDILPSKLCNRIFNIFHPADPVVYRLEPLVNKMYSYVDPVPIHRLDQINKSQYDDIPIRKSQADEDELMFDESSFCEASFIPGNEGKVKDDTVKVSQHNNTVKGDLNVTLTEKLMRFLNKFAVRNSDKILPHVHKLKFLIPSAEQGPSNEEKKKRKSSFKHSKNNLRKIAISKLIKTQVSASTQSLHRRGASSFRFTKLRQLQDLRQSLRIRRQVLSITNDSGNNSVFDGGFIRESSSIEDLPVFSDIESNFSNSDSQLDEGSTVGSTISLSQPSADVANKELKRRIDFILPESRYENSYLSVLTSHTCYWSSGELCQFMLTQIFGHLGRAGNPI